jgi:predicted transcriptional regulator of viral defense system
MMQVGIMSSDPSKMDAVRALARARGLIRARDLDDLGAPRAYLARLVADGSLVRVGRGVYASADNAPSQHHTLAMVAARVPGAVYTLLTALRFHELGSESPWQVWVALPRGHWRPELEGCAIEATWLEPLELARDVETHAVEGVDVKVFTPERAVVECFRFRSKVGLEPCLEALRDYLRRNPGGVDALWAVARRRRVASVLRPYLEALS